MYQKQNINYAPRLFHQQLGFEIPSSFNAALQRLRCLQKDSYSSIWADERYSGNECPIFTCEFAKKKGYENYVAMANEDGELVVHNIENTQKSNIPKGGAIHNNAIFDLAWLSDSFKLLTVSGDHTARLIDVEQMQAVKVFIGHTRSVKTIAVRESDDSVFATGSRDGKIHLWDMRCHTESNVFYPDRTITHAQSKNIPNSSHKKNHKQAPADTLINSVTSLVFQDDNALISCGAGDGIIKVWDLRKTYVNNKPVAMKEISYSGASTRNGFSHIMLDNSRKRLYANCLDNTIYCYNVATYNSIPVMEYVGHKNSTFYIKSTLSPDGNYIFSGSSDHNAYIWNINEKNPIVRLIGHTAEVTCVAWCQKEPLTLLTCSDDYYHKYWHIGSEKVPDNWAIEGSGMAEIISEPSKKLKRYLDINENTPHRLKLEFCNKRSLDEDSCFLPEAKRFNSNRRLFAIQEVQNEIEPSCSKDEDLAVILETDEFCKTPKASIIPKQRTPEETFSPTTNLPNFVIDGSAPHLHFSPQKRCPKDWLTTMRVERKLHRDMEDVTIDSPSSPKIAKLNDLSPSSSRSNMKTPRRRKSRSSSGNTPKQSPILKFFRVTNSNILNNTQCSSKIVNSKSENSTESGQK